MRPLHAEDARQLISEALGQGVDPATSPYFWLGATDQAEQGVFRWADGTAVPP